MAPLINQNAAGSTAPFIRNIDQDNVVRLTDLVTTSEGQVVSRTLTQNGHVGLTLFAFAAGTSISAHESRGDAMVTVLEGTGELVVGEKTHTVQAGETLVMPANVAHSVAGVTDMKMILTVVFPA